MRYTYHQASLQSLSQPWQEMEHVPLLQQLLQAEFFHIPVDQATRLLLVFWLQVAANINSIRNLSKEEANIFHSAAGTKYLILLITKCTASMLQTMLQKLQNQHHRWSSQDDNMRFCKVMVTMWNYPKTPLFLLLSSQYYIFQHNVTSNPTIGERLNDIL